MKNLDEAIFFRFEEDFVEANLRCIPMIVRFKLDACGIKLTLAAWSRMTPVEREHLAHAPCDSVDSITRYRENLTQWIVQRTGEVPTALPVAENPPWSRRDAIPYTIQERLAQIPATLSIEQWQQLADLQRFALLKLSYGGHENENFPKALREFGIMG